MCPRLELITSTANHALITITLHLGDTGRSSGPQDGQSGTANKATLHECVCVCLCVPDGLIFSVGGGSCSGEPQRLTGRVQGGKKCAGQNNNCWERHIRYCR